MNIIVARVVQRHQLRCVTKGPTVETVEVDVLVELVLDPTSVDRAFRTWYNCLLHPFHGLGSRQLAKSIVVEGTIIFARGARIKIPQL